MSHVRKQIREAVVSAVTGLTTTGSNVFEARIFNFNPSNLPALIVSTPSETSFPNSFPTPRPIERDLEVLIVGYARENSNLEDKLDLIAKEVETALASDLTLGGLCKDLSLSSTKSELTGEGQKPLGIIQLVFNCRYMTKENAPQTAF